MSTFNFTRPAHGRSYSNRMAKVGKPFDGTLREAIIKAQSLSFTEGAITINDDKRAVANVTRFKNHTSPEMWIQVTFLADLSTQALTL